MKAFCTSDDAKRSSIGQYLSQRLTVLFVTSPSIAHPSPRLIEEVACSLSLVEGLKQCNKIIIADGIKLADKDVWKQGKVTEEYFSRYQTYLRRLSVLTKQAGSPLAG
eukprot:CAMPEP_0118949494 /NCGR_PEP_ID=MMETSP1169-20130426/49743_1 /TAXON_ID=36882 /ORGANISM="Pyramimonas obovata, Strain CCMP722" /LENGTH=107 /DNA_ID=CAMNT_0006896143 /DNA_START=148 /DNA_END=467 /DNA_ORIENTATION=-